jgi:hypothetical protein
MQMSLHDIGRPASLNLAKKLTLKESNLNRYYSDQFLIGQINSSQFEHHLLFSLMLTPPHKNYFLVEKEFSITVLPT